VKFNNAEKRVPVRDKTDLLQCTYKLGEEKNDFTTVNRDQFWNKSKVEVLDLKTRAKPVRYDIVTNEGVQKERLAKASGFDFCNPERAKNLTSNNVTDFPQAGVKKDVITGRVLASSRPF